MASGNGLLPPMGKISLIGIWIETVLYGVNCIFYGLCMFILFRERKVVPLRRTLVVSSTMLFLLCTIHVGASLRQLLEAFVYAPDDIPDYDTIYWLDYASILYLMKADLYITLVLVQGLIIIWRLYAVFMHNWRVVIVPVILLSGCVGSAYAASSVYGVSSGGYRASTTANLVISAWACGSTLNTSVTGAIVIRLWQMGRTMAYGTAKSTNRFQSSIYMIIESGAISAIANAVVLGFLISNSPAALSSMNVAAQLIGLSPFLIIVQVGRHHISGGEMPSVQDEIRFRAGDPRGDSLQDLSTYSH